MSLKLCTFSAILLMAVLSSGCSQPPEHQRSKNEIEIVLPEGWRKELDQDDHAAQRSMVIMAGSKVICFLRIAEWGSKGYETEAEDWLEDYVDMNLADPRYKANSEVETGSIERGGVPGRYAIIKLTAQLIGNIEYAEAYVINSDDLTVLLEFYGDYPVADDVKTGLGKLLSNLKPQIETK